MWFIFFEIGWEKKEVGSEGVLIVWENKFGYKSTNCKLYSVSNKANVDKQKLKMPDDDEDFEQRELEILVEFLWAQGEYIGKREYYRMELILFLLDKEYLEVWSDSDGRVSKLSSISDSKTLALYLDDLSLTQLFEV